MSYPRRRRIRLRRRRPATPRRCRLGRAGGRVRARLRGERRHPASVAWCSLLSPLLHETARQTGSTLAAPHDPGTPDDPCALKTFDLKLYHIAIAELV